MVASPETTYAAAAVALLELEHDVDVHAVLDMASGHVDLTLGLDAVDSSSVLVHSCAPAVAHAAPACAYVSDVHAEDGVEKVSGVGAVGAAAPEGDAEGGALGTGADVGDAPLSEQQMR